MRYGSVCSGIEAASVAWAPLGWRAAFLSEIEAFPSTVLAHRFPGVPNLGDITKFRDWPDETIDILVGGTPCQSFSVAGLRKGLADPRGNLALTYLAVAERYRPRWLVWENVPGIRSSLTHDAPDLRPPNIDLDSDNAPTDGEEIMVEDQYNADESHAFACFLAGLSELGYGWAYRSLDAQYAGLAQRRERVFVVGYLGDWRRAAEVLFEPESLSGHTPACVAARQDAARRAAPAAGGGRLWRQIARAFGAGATVGWCREIAATLNAQYGDKQGLENQHALNDGSLFVSPALSASDRGTARAGDSRGQDCLVPVAFSSKDHGADAGDLSPTLRAMGHDGSLANAGGQVAIAIPERAVCENPDAGPDGAGWRGDGAAYTLEARAVPQAVAVRTAQTKANGHVIAVDQAHALDSRPNQAVAFAENQRGELRTREVAQQLTAGGGKPGQGYPAMTDGCAIRRLTPRECERLQGFPDDFTRIPWRCRPAGECPDSPRYKAIGNSMPVPVMRWIGERIDRADGMTAMQEAAE